MKNIVDGVDVSGCEFYTANIKYNCKLDTVGGDNTCFICSNNPNCYYKQLQRLKQENKKLEDSNKNLKLTLETYQMPEVVKVLTDWKTGELDLQEHKLQKYEQALEEIRDEMSDKYQFGGLNGYGDFCGYYEREYTRIINKIDEVLK